MVLCYEKKTLYSLCKTHISFIIYNKSIELLAQLLNSYVVFFKIIFYLCTTPCISYYCFTCTAFYFFVRTPTNQVLNDYRLEHWVADVLCSVVQISLTTLICVAIMQFKIPYKVSHGPICIVEL